jgi:hypothetical protein
MSLRRLFKKEKQERRILRQIERSGDQLQPEYHRSMPECSMPIREREIPRFLPQINPYGLIPTPVRI